MSRSRRLISLPRPALQAPRYCLSFTAAGLRPELAAVIAGIHLEQGYDWRRTKAAVLKFNALQARSASTGKRLESELRQRLQLLTPSQLHLLAKGTSDERHAMAWIAVLKRFQMAAALVREVLQDKISSLDPVLRRSELAHFYECTEREHPELAALAPSSQQKVRSAVLQMLREAGLLAGKPGKGGTLGMVQRPHLSPQAEEVVMEDDPELLVGVLQPLPSRLATSRKQVVKPKPKAATKPSAKKDAPARRKAA